MSVVIELFKPGMRRPVASWHAPQWFIRIASVRECLYACVCVYVCVYVCVCSPPRLLITSGVMWCNIDWSNKYYGFYMASLVGIISGRGISIHMCCGN